MSKTDEIQRPRFARMYMRCADNAVFAGSRFEPAIPYILGVARIAAR